MLVGKREMQYPENDSRTFLYLLANMPPDLKRKINSAPLEVQAEIEAVCRGFSDRKELGICSVNEKSRVKIVLAFYLGYEDWRDAARLYNLGLKDPEANYRLWSSFKLTRKTEAQLKATGDVLAKDRKKREEASCPLFEEVK